MTDEQAGHEIDAAYQALGGVGAAPRALQVQVRELEERCQQLEERNCKLRVRLQVVRSWMNDVDWDLLCRASPAAQAWFDDVGEPV